MREISRRNDSSALDSRRALRCSSWTTLRATPKKYPTRSAYEETSTSRHLAATLRTVSMARSSGFAHRRPAKKNTSLRMISAHLLSASRLRSGPGGGAVRIQEIEKLLPRVHSETWPRHNARILSSIFTAIPPAVRTPPSRTAPPAILPPHLELRLTQRGGRGALGLQHLDIESPHQLAGGLVIDLPQARHHALRSGVEKAANHPGQAFSLQLLAEGGAARAQHDQFSGEAQTVDVVQTQESVLRLSVLVVQRQHQTGEPGILVVDNAVRREVDDSVLRQCGPERGGAARIETGSLQRQASGSGRDDGISFLTRRRQPRPPAAVLTNPRP